MRGSRGNALGRAAAALAVALAVAGCGGARQDTNEPAGNYTVSVNPSFPGTQRLSQPQNLTIAVTNHGAKALPNVAVTVDGLNHRLTGPPGIASAERPVWIIDVGPGAKPSLPVATEGPNTPGGGVTAFTNTWALGPLRPGETTVFRWHLTPVFAGSFDVKYTVAAGLNGKAHARLADGSIPTGDFPVIIVARPAPSYVNPNTGQVVHTPPPQRTP